MAAHTAKTHFSKLLRDVENGETATITRYGIAVARIVHIQDPYRDASAAIEELRRFREEHQIRLGDDFTLRELIENGRRWSDLRLQQDWRDRPMPWLFAFA